MEEDAETLCKTFLDKSIEYDPKNPETLQLLASYWLSKDDLEQAKKFILESVDAWLPKYIEASENGPLVDPSQAITLSYDSRINTGRILTEVEEYDKAIIVLDQLVEEDDEVIYVWYMLGWVNYCKGEEYFTNAKFYLKKADEVVLILNFFLFLIKILEFVCNNKKAYYENKIRAKVLGRCFKGPCKRAFREAG